MIIKNCKICGKKFFTFPSKLKKGKGKFCSRKCFNQWQIGRNNFKLRKGEFRICLIYNKRFWVADWRIRIGKGKYCSKECFYQDIRNGKTNKGHFKKGHKVPEEWRKKLNQKGNHRSPKSEFKTGKNHPNFNNYSSFEPYGPEFNNKLKEQTRKRDNLICQKCSKTQEEELKEIYHKLSIHHIDYDKKNCNPNNLITLCNTCNTKVNKNRKFWTWYFKLILSSKSHPHSKI